MSFRYIGGFPDAQVVELPCAAGVAIAEGDALDGIASTNQVIRVTGSSTIHTLLAVAAETITTSATRIKCLLVNQGMLWSADTTNNTHATNQTLQSCIFTDSKTLSNTGSDVTGNTAIFQIFAPIGLITDKKVIGEFQRSKSTS